MEISVVFNQMGVLFILMALGFVLGKTKILTQDGNKILTKIVLFFALPATILSSILHSTLDVTLGTILYTLGMSVITYALLVIISYPFIRLMGGNKANRGLYSASIMLGNSAFMGIPVVLAIFGVAGTFLAALHNIMFNLLAFSFGIMMISRKVSKFDPRMLLNPILLITVLLTPIAIFEISFPPIVTQSITTLGEMTTPAAMFIIGSTLAFIPLKSISAQWRVIPITILKLVVVPVVVWFILRLFITDELLLGVLVVLSSMPTAVAVSMISIEYDGDEQTASAIVFLTTILSAITVPAIVFFLLM